MNHGQSKTKKDSCQTRRPHRHTAQSTEQTHRLPKHVSPLAPAPAPSAALILHYCCPSTVHRFNRASHRSAPSLHFSTPRKRVTASRHHNRTRHHTKPPTPHHGLYPGYVIQAAVHRSPPFFLEAPPYTDPPHTDYVTLLPRLLPPSIASPLLTLVTTAFGISRTLQTHLTPLFTRLITQPDAASILVVVAALFISFKILDMMYRAVLFWVNMVFRLVLWGGIGLIGLWVYNRGVDGFVQDVQELATKWAGEYEKYSGEVKQYQQAQEAQIRMQAKQQGGKRGWR